MREAPHNMYAHVTTDRLGTSAETYDDMEHAAETGDPITDQSARTIASWWHSPSDRARNLTALSHGLPFDTDELWSEVKREVTDPDDRDALLTWLDHLEAVLTAA